MNLTDRYSHEVFNDLDGPVQANNLLRDIPDAIHQLGEVIRKHGLENDLRIRLLHKHYSLDRDEIVVAKIEENQILIRPRKQKDCAARPTAWMFHKSEWRPFEFMEEADGGSVLAEQTERIKQAPGFLREFSQKAQDMNLANVLGIALLLSGVIAMPTGYVWHENTDEASRTSTVELADKGIRGPNIIDTYWAFSGGILVSEGSCGHKPGP
ncbi:MAG: hypothetical protein OEY86_18775 [Nitrospira sp.]|nr:hypothetical protein [Nitrospira sp.]